LCHRRRAWMRLLPPRPLLSSVAADGIRPARAEQARNGTEKQGARQRRSSPFPLLASESGALHGGRRRDDGLELLRRTGDEEGPQAPPPCRPFLPSPPPLHITSTSWPRSPLLLFFTGAGAGTRRGPLFSGLSCGDALPPVDLGLRLLIPTEDPIGERLPLTWPPGSTGKPTPPHRESRGTAAPSPALPRARGGRLLPPPPACGRSEYACCFYPLSIFKSTPTSNGEGMSRK
jgi:hypothetical protein